MPGVFRTAGVLLGALLCLAGGADGAAPGQFVDSAGRVVQRPVPKLIGPDGKVIDNPDLAASRPAPPPDSPPVAPPPPPAAPPTSISEDGGITLDFVNADIRDVAKTVLGDFLGLNYAVGASVTGTVTIQTSRPVPRADVLAVIEQALQLNNLALVKRANIYNILPLADARHQAGAAPRNPNGGEPGFGVQIVPLKYVGAVQIQHLLEPLVPSQAVVYADAQRNLLVIQGTAAERAAMAEQIALFDVDWLQKMSFRLLTPKYTDVGPLAKELQEFLGGDHGTLSDFVRLVPIQRLNAILAISSQPRYLTQLDQLMTRLDQPGRGYARRVFFYPVQNSRASDLAAALNRSFYGDNYRPPADDTARGDAADDFSGPLSTAGTPITPPVSTSPTLPAAPPQVAGPSESPDSGANAIVTVDKSNNALLINGTPQQYAAIREVLRDMDVAPVQVQLEAVIAEVTLNDGLEYGVQYFYQPNNKHELSLTDSKSINITPNLPGFSYIFTQGSNIRIILNALSQVTHVEVVSSPNVMVLNNQTALLQVGDQVPISTGQAVSVTSSDAPIVNSIAYHATGVILKVTPSVNRSGLVTLEVLQEVSSVAPQADQSSTIGSPTFTERKIKSTVVIHDKETVALGGMISNSRTRGSSGLPFLSELPVVGGLFGTKQNDTNRTELMVLITPHVVENLEAARAVTEELRRKFPSITPKLLHAEQ